MTSFIHFFTLLFKNFKVQFRHYWITAIELFIPIISILLLLVLRFSSSFEESNTETIFSSYDINSLSSDHYDKSKDISIYYTPKSIFLDNVMQNVSRYLNISTVGFNNETELVTSYEKSTSKVIGGIIFSNNLTDGVQNAGPISFVIRPESIPGVAWNLSYVLPKLPIPYVTDMSVYGSYYMEYGFLPIQHAVAKTLIQSIITDWDQEFDEFIQVEMRRLPYSPYHSDSFYNSSEYYFAVAIGVCFFIPSAFIAKTIVHEKETKLKETILLMGHSNWQNWLAWFIKDFIFLFLICGIICGILSIRFTHEAILNRSDESLVFLWLILYACNVIAFTYFITTFFETGNPAVSAACILFIITFVPYIHSRGLFHQITVGYRLILCLLPNVLFAYSVRLIVRMEWIGSEFLAVGLKWENMQYTSLIKARIGMNVVFLMLIIDFLLYILLTWYIEVMRPGKFQKKYPWYFPCMASYWTGSYNVPSEPSELRSVKSEFYEKDPLKVKPMIYLKNVTKVYDGITKPVIKTLNLKAYKGQITVLLSHNCAGKSTIASMLYGAVPPTSGSVIIKSLDVFKSGEVEKICPLLGICPDYDIFIDELTVQENLYFFCMSKGLRSTAMKDQADHIMELFDLEIKKRHLVSSLTTNVKRRLTIGISLIGESEIVVLDEPTLNMKYSNKRMVWEALLQEKEHRAIFLTTGDIKEADTLADKIAVIHNGKLMCSGSPGYLKKKYGIGYQLIIQKKPESNISGVKNIVASKISDSVVLTENENKIQFMLPLDDRKLYSVLLKEIEEKDFKIERISVTETPLDILFERMVDENFENPNKSVDDLVMRLSQIYNSNVSESSDVDTNYQTLTKKRNEGHTLLWQHIRSLTKKRFICSVRNYILTASQILVLPLILIFSNLMQESSLQTKEEIFNEKLFSLESFGRTNIVYGIDPSSNVTIGLGDTYAKLLDDVDSSLYMVDLDEENYIDYLLTQSERDLIHYKTKYIIGAVFKNVLNKTIITAIFNAEAYHAAPISLMYLHNTILAYYLGNRSYYFDVNSLPLHFKESEHKFFGTKTDLDMSFFWTEDLMIGMSILMCSFVVILVLEKSSKSKKQQIIAGLNAFVYWFTSFIYDFLIYLIPCALTVAVFCIFKTDCLSGLHNLGSLILLLVLHGIAALLYIYVCTFYANSSSVAYSSIFIYYFLGLCALFAVFKFEEKNLFYISDILNLIFTFLMPSYCVGRGIYNVHKNCVINYICNNDAVHDMCDSGNITPPIVTSCCLDTCGDKCLYWSASHLSVSMAGIGYQLISLSFQPFIYIGIITLYELGVFQDCKFKNRYLTVSHPPEDKEKVDIDIQEETNKINSTPLSELKQRNYLIVKMASKFLSEEFKISKLSFGVRKGECFGLLGLKLAGKSTVLEMIAGSTSLSSGNVYIHEYDCTLYPHKVQDKIGFTFGNKALLKQLTVKETLRLYACIRGIPDEEIKYFVKYLTEILSLKPDVLVYKCNAIDRRKLSVAIAVIGTPPLILLDEPTAKMDPQAYMDITKAIIQAKKTGCTIFLSSQWIEDCQAFCNHIGILVKGKLNYIGDFDRLKKKFENGYTLILKVNKTKMSRSRYTRQIFTIKGYLDDLKENVNEILPNAIIKAEYSRYIDYYIPEIKIKWSKLFVALEHLKFREIIEDYNIFETNLKHIYSYLVTLDDMKSEDISQYLRKRKKSKF